MSTNVVTSPSDNQATGRDYLRLFSLVLVCIGLFISGYISYTKIVNTEMVCVEGGAFNCGVVTSSAYSRFMGIEIAYLGFLMYATVGLLLMLESRSEFLQIYGPMLVFGITLFAWIFSMWLVYVQFFLLEALCPWCLSHELNMTVLFFTTAIRLQRALSSEV